VNSDVTPSVERADRRAPIPIKESVVAYVALALATGGMLLVRGRLDKAHVSLIYLLVVLGGSAAAGRLVGVSLGVSAFLLFNLLFLPPYYTFTLTDPLDWLVLIVFLATSIVAAELLDRQRRQAELAAARTRELDRLTTLGAETLNAVRAEQALVAIADVIRQTVGVETCELFVWERDRGELRRVASTPGQAMSDMGSVADSTELLKYVASTRRSAIERADGTIHVVDDSHGESKPPADRTGRAFAIALAARGETVGALRISGREAFTLSADQWRVLTALAYYAALATYRLRLEKAEETAETLRRADRLKDALLAAVSHDLRTPLTTIKGIAHEIAHDGQPRATIIEEEADRLASLVDDLLEMSQIDAGAVEVAAELNTVDDVIGAALQRAETVLGDHPIETYVAVHALLVGRFDFGHTLRILVNLLENAAKYSPSGAPIALGAERRGDRLEITVADRGSGIVAAERDRIFEPFYRAPGTRPDVRGAGLGLSIARRLAEAQNGTLSVSERAGGGSLFTLALPAAELPP
jgi:two-component system, OmpR family, sensor histidine kinase KdpD